MLKMPYSLSKSIIKRTIKFKNAIWMITSEGEIIRVCFEKELYEACIDDAFQEKEKKKYCNLI